MSINIGTRRECFFDEFLIDKEKTSARQIVHSPAKQEIVMDYKGAWEKGVSYVNFFRDGDIYRMYYIGWNMLERAAAKSGEEGKTLRACYAESRDGIHFEKPELGLYSYHGNKRNNIIIMGEWLDNFYVFKDKNPACPPEKRYKAISGVSNFMPCGEHVKKLTVFYSADGIHFEKGEILDLMGAFDSLNVIFWDEDAKLYRAYFRSFHGIPDTDGGDYADYLRENGDFTVHTKADLNMGVRDIRYSESEDFVHWSKPQILCFTNKRDLPLYTNNVQKYERAPHIFIGFPTRYVERPEWTEAFDELCGVQARHERIEKMEKREGLAVTDALFMASHDGMTFTRFDEAMFRNGPEYGGNWIYGDCYPGLGMFETPGLHEGEDPVYSMFCHEYANDLCSLRRYTIRKDGFVSIHADADESVLVTKPFTFDGKALFANMATSAYGYMYFTLRDKDGKEYESVEMFGDRISKHIRFKDDISALAGRDVTLTVRMCDADLYSIKFSESEDHE